MEWTPILHSPDGLSGSLVIYDALGAIFSKVRVGRDPTLVRTRATITYISGYK